MLLVLLHLQGALLPPLDLNRPRRRQVFRCTCGRELCSRLQWGGRGVLINKLVAVLLQMEDVFAARAQLSVSLVALHTQLTAGYHCQLPDRQ
jgi:hypothetical protein